MTTPVTQGAPDWSRQAPWSDQILINDQNVTNASPHVYPAMYVGNIRALLFHFTPQTADADVTITWYADLAATQILKADSVDTGNGQPIEFTIRPYSPVMKVTVQISGAGSLTYNLFVTTIADTSYPLYSTWRTQIIYTLGQAIGASSAVTVQAAWSFIGYAFVQGYTSGTSWDFQVFSKDFNGNIRQLLTHDNGRGQTPDYIYLPGGHLYATMNNRDAAAHAFSLYVMGDPMALR